MFMCEHFSVGVCGFLCTFALSTIVHLQWFFCLHVMFPDIWEIQLGLHPGANSAYFSLSLFTADSILSSITQQSSCLVSFYSCYQCKYVKSEKKWSITSLIVYCFFYFKRCTTLLCFAVSFYANARWFCETRLHRTSVGTNMSGGIKLLSEVRPPILQESCFPSTKTQR